MKSGTTKGAKGAKDFRGAIEPVGGSFKEQAQRAWARELAALQTRARVLVDALDLIWEAACERGDVETRDAAMRAGNEAFGLYELLAGRTEKTEPRLCSK